MLFEDERLPVKFKGKMIQMKAKRKNRKGINFSLRRWAEFFKTTDFHGYKYIVMPNLNIFERFSWVLAVLCCMSSAVYLLNTAWNWYARNPTVTVTESTHSPIWDIPFPAVTVCDLNAVSRPLALSKAKSLIKPENVTAEDLFGFLKYMSIMTAPFQTTDEVRANLSLLQDVLDLNNVSIGQLYTDFAPSCMELIERCSWKNTIYRCDLLFRRILTSDGFCCAFNYFATDQPAELAKINEMFLLKKPRRVASCGHLTALAFMINIKPSNYYSARYASYGARVFVDYAYYFPDRNSPVNLVNPKTELFIAVSPEVTYATKGVSNLDPAVRKCRFEEEATLSTLKTYSYHNCLAECQAIFYETLCGCVLYNLPHNGSVRECDFKDVSCLEKEKNWDHKSDTNKIRNMLKDKCGCVPDCEYINYPLEITTGRLSRKGSVSGKAFYKGVKLLNHSVVNVYFEDLVSIRYRRDVYLNFQNLIASFGGLLSLLLGFTLISAFDFLYFFSIRIIFDLFVTEKGRQQGTLEKVDSSSKSMKADKLKSQMVATSYVHNQNNVPIFKIKISELKSTKLQVKEAHDRRN